MQRIDVARFQYRRMRHWARLACHIADSILEFEERFPVKAPSSLRVQYNRARAYARDYQADLLDSTGRAVS